jgi:hypothetical protein
MKTVQTAHDVSMVLCAIAELDFDIGMYIYTAGIGSGLNHVCFVAHGKHRRYFLVKSAEKTNPIINLLDYSESRKMIHEVDRSKIVGQVRFSHLIDNDQNGVFRGLGLYGALYEQGSLELSDFRPVEWSMSSTYEYCATTVNHIHSLEVSGGYPSRALCTKEEAHAAAAKVNHPSCFGVVYNYLGSATAVYHRGVRVV